MCACVRYSEWSTCPQHSSLDQHKEKIRAVIKLAQHTLKDDFKLMKTATSLSSQLADVSNYPSNIDMGSIGDMRYHCDSTCMMTC